MFSISFWSYFRNDSLYCKRPLSLPFVLNYTNHHTFSTISSSLESPIKAVIKTMIYHIHQWTRTGHKTRLSVTRPPATDRTCRGNKLQCGNAFGIIKRNELWTTTVLLLFVEWKMCLQRKRWKLESQIKPRMTDPVNTGGEWDWSLIKRYISQLVPQEYAAA